MRATEPHCRNLPPLAERRQNQEMNNRLCATVASPPRNIAYKARISYSPKGTPRTLHVKEGLECIPTFDSVKQILSTIEIIAEGGIHFEKEIRTVVCYMEMLVPRMEKIFLVHFRCPHASPLLDSCLGYRRLFPVNCHVI